MQIVRKQMGKWMHWFTMHSLHRDADCDVSHLSEWIKFILKIAGGFPLLFLQLRKISTKRGGSLNPWHFLQHGGWGAAWHTWDWSVDAIARKTVVLSSSHDDEAAMCYCFDVLIILFRLFSPLVHFLVINPPPIDAFIESLYLQHPRCLFYSPLLILNAFPRDCSSFSSSSRGNNFRCSKWFAHFKELITISLVIKSYARGTLGR